MRVAMKDSVNVLGGPLKACSFDPVTGSSATAAAIPAPRIAAATPSACGLPPTFLAFSERRGNDLSTPRPEFGFPGLRPGDRWCLCADRWREAWAAGVAPKVVLASTHRLGPRHDPVEVLRAHAMPGRAPQRR